VCCRLILLAFHCSRAERSSPKAGNSREVSTVAAIMLDEEVLSKKGSELFRELQRLYPVADVEDYYKLGAWKEDLMKTDMQLIDAHRKEAGAPDPVPLEDIPEPELPKTPALLARVGILGSGIRPLVPGGALAALAPRPAGAAATAATRPAALTPLRPGLLAPATKAGPVAAPPGSAATDLRLIALFVNKWKLEPTKTKMMLAKLTQEKRRYVIQNFKATVAGPTATPALEQFIAQCERTGAWGASAAAPAAKPAVLGIKRPLAPPILDPNKRPRFAGQVAGTRPAPAASPALARLQAAARPSAVRPLQPAAVRPLIPGGVRAAQAARPPAPLRPAAGVRPPAAIRPGPAVRPPAAVRTARPPSRPPPGVRPADAPKAKAATGSLIKNLLQRF